jgi:DNA polymerase-3 subunit epsilon
VVVDVETSGLNARRDRLLAIAAIALRVDWARAWPSCPATALRSIWHRTEASSRSNILLHGIGAARQQAGADPAQAMQAFAAYVADAPLLAFHAWFDQTLMWPLCAGAPGPGTVANPWVDIEHLCAVTHEGVRARSLDEWMAHFGITCAVRHQAAADTLAECELLQRVWPRVAAQCRDWRSVQKLAAQQRWIARA